MATITLLEYVEELNGILLANPDIAGSPVYYASDDEGNGYEVVHFAPSVQYFTSENERVDEEEALDYEATKNVCLN